MLWLLGFIVKIKSVLKLLGFIVKIKSVLYLLGFIVKIKSALVLVDHCHVPISFPYAKRSLSANDFFLKLLEGETR